MSEKQLEAVTCGLGPVMISAGPGSGKTFVVTHRILYLIHKMNLSPQSIFIITFTKEAALSMSGRYLNLLKGIYEAHPDAGAVHFGTFHSFFYQIIRSNPQYHNFKLINSSGKSGILFRVLKNRKEEFYSQKELQRIFADISFYKNTGELRSGLTEDFLTLIKEYDAEKKKAQVLDFDDMLTLCYDMLQEDKELLRCWQDKIGYLLVDEFQDTNSVQYEIMKLLTAEKGNVCVVGDDDQAIYGFRGSKPGIMYRFLEDYDKVKHITLGTNYRCGKEIVSFSARLIQNNVSRISKELSASNIGKENSVMIKGFDSHRDMIKDCLKKLQEYTPEDLEHVAVLFRTNARINLFLLELIKCKIPFQTKEKISSIYEHFIVKDMMDYLKASRGNRERELFLRILNKPRTRIGRESLLEETVDLEDIIQFYGEKGIRNFAAQNDAIRFKKGLETLSKLPLSLGIGFIMHYFGYEAYLKNKAAGDKALLEEWNNVIKWLKEDSAGFSGLKEWEQFQLEYESKADKDHMRKDNKPGVHVMTLHGCKGLEFDRVMVLHVNEGNIPNLKHGENLTKEALEEERRLFYVGLTRAKEALDILYVNHSQENPKPPSRFLKELQD